MRIAIFSDVHGNAHALQAVLDAIAADGPFDHVAAAGDHAFAGSEPGRCVDLLREAGVEAIYGNTDLFIHSPERKPGDEQHLRKWGPILQDAAWARERMTDDQVSWLASLPFELRYNPGVAPEDELLVFHANPVDVERVIYPSPHTQLAYFERIHQPDSDPTLAGWMENTSAGTMAFGHLHLMSERSLNGKWLVNVAPVSLPAVDGDARARYTIFTWADSGWDIERRLIDYDYTQEVSGLAMSGMPHWESHAAAFQKKSPG